MRSRRARGSRRASRADPRSRRARRIGALRGKHLGAACPECGITAASCVRSSWVASSAAKHRTGAERETGTPAAPPDQLIHHHLHLPARDHAHVDYVSCGNACERRKVRSASPAALDEARDVARRKSSSNAGW